MLCLHRLHISVKTVLHYWYRLWISCQKNRFGSVMVSVCPASVVDHGFQLCSDQTKDHTIGIYCFFDKHATLRIKNKDSLVRNQEQFPLWSDMSTRELFFQWASTINSNRAYTFSTNLSSLSFHEPQSKPGVNSFYAKQKSLTYSLLTVKLPLSKNR